MITKKIIQTLAVLFLTLNLSAQYKKASFFEKTGRTYEFGTRVFMMGDGKGSPIGYTLGFGRDKGKRFFKSWELEFLPSHKYSYKTVDQYTQQPMTVSGKSEISLIYGLNYGYHLLKNSDGQKLQPYVLAGLNIVIIGGPKDDGTYSPDPNSYPRRMLITNSVSIGLNAGLGCLINLSPTCGFKLQAGYDHQFNMDSYLAEVEEKPYFMFTSHPFVSAGFRVKIVKN